MGLNARVTQKPGSSNLALAELIIGILGQPEPGPEEHAFQAQCLAGHVFTCPADSELEYRARARMGEGYIDAIPVTSGQCPVCRVSKVFWPDY